MEWHKYPALSFRGKIYPDSSAKKTDYDVILVSGDAYVDHPAFPAAVVCRSIERLGLNVAVIAQPDWANDEDFLVWGEPKKFFAVVPGAMDSMVANYTSTRMPRSKDRLSPGGKTGLRPKRAAQVYVQKLRQLFKKKPIVIGGIEASLRRFIHYDFWEDKLRDPILMDAPADILVYGMAEATIAKLAERFEQSSELIGIAQTCVRVKHDSWREWLKEEPLILPSVQECRDDSTTFLKMAITLDKSVRTGGKVLIQQHPKGDIVCFPPERSDYRKEIEVMAKLKFNRRAHPIYTEPVPALEPVQFSVQSHRGCVGACTFCALALHQGREIRSRSQSDIIAEVESFLTHPDFRGVIPDLGGPAVNMYGWDCKTGGCSEGICTVDKLCPNMVGGLKPIADLLERVAKIKGVKHVFLGSGLRYDLIKPSDWQTFADIILNHVSGQLKVAPEHFDREILRLMRKGASADFAAFAARFYETCKKKNLRLFLVPYLMTAFPGCESNDKILARKIRELKLVHEQIQEFTPTPGSLASAMYYAEKDFNLKSIKVLKNRADRLKTRNQLHSVRKNTGKKKK